MDAKIKILLGSKKNLNSINKETYTRIELNNRKEIISEYEQKNFISASDVFNSERQETNVYRFYGRIEFLSLLNGLKFDYDNINQLFNEYSGNIKTLLNSFDFYLVKPSINCVKITNKDNQYIRKMQVIATPDQFDIFEAGFSNNVFDDIVYSFNLNEDIDFANDKDYFNFPLTDVFIYAKYKKYNTEVLKKSEYNITDGSEYFITDNITNKYVIGDEITCDIIEFDRYEYLQTIIKTNTHKIQTYFMTGGTIQWTYNPFIPLKLKYLSSVVSRENKVNTSYDISTNIPDHAILLNPNSPDDMTYVWREIIPQGSYDPITDEGVDYPFVNKRRYLFKPFTLDVIPDLDDLATYIAFKELKFGDPSDSYMNPLTDINNIGKPCQ
jgi:hypothetical protein